MTEFYDRAARDAPRDLKAIIYCRVSSVAQTKKGDGLASQETRCREYAAYKGYTVVKTVVDRAISGGVLDRPGIKELIQFLKREKHADRYVVLFDDISRLARDIRTHLDLRDAIFATGAQMDCPTLEFRQDSDGLYFEGMQALNAEHYRRKNAEQTKNRMRARAMGGYWPFRAPPGYTFKRVAGHGNLLVRDEPVASILQEALEGFASGRFDTQAEVKRFLDGQPSYMAGRKNRELRYEDVIRLLTRPHYAGYIEIAEWGVTLRKGHHEGLIDLAQFEKIQARIREGARAPARKDLNEDFPLRGFATCGDCGKPLTANWSKSKTGAKHPYYMCFAKDCPSYRKSIRRATIEGDFEALLARMTPTVTTFEIARAMFREAWDTRLAQAREIAATLKTDIAKIDRQIDHLLDRIVDAGSQSAVTAYERRIAKLEKDKLLAAERLAKKPGSQRDFDEMFELACRLLSSPCKIWINGDLALRRTVLKLAFAARPAYCRKDGFRTPKTTLPFKVLGEIGAGKRGMAEREGFEPSERLRAQRFSRPPRSTTPAPLRKRLAMWSRRDRVHNEEREVAQGGV